MPHSRDEIREEILELEQRLARLRVQLPAASKIDPASSLLLATAPQVLNATYSIRHGLTVLQDAIDREEKQHLFAAVRRAATKIESLTRPLLEVARHEVVTPTERLRPYSIDTLLKESALYVQSYLGDQLPIAIESKLRGEDLIVYCEPRRIRDMVSHATIFLALSLKSGRLRIALDTVGDRSIRKLRWSLSCSDFELRSREMSPADLKIGGYDGTGERALARSVFFAQADIVNGVVKALDVPPGILLEHELAELHDVPPLTESRLHSAWTQQPIIICEPPPTEFVGIDAELVMVTDEDQLPVKRIATNASLLVLHHVEQPPPTIIALNIRRAHKAGLPVLLRASRLDYQEYLDYRNTVDAILLEPCRVETLARYVIGLSQHDRRSGHRQAQLH